jgi:16S rRNA (cytosine967-C5)-methyltransferase
MRKSAREIALRILHLIETQGAFANEAVAELVGEYCNTPLQVNSLDKRFITELVIGTTKFRERIDYGLNVFLKKGMMDLTPWIRNILRMGVYQLDFLDKVPASAAVNESAKLAKKFGHKGTVSLVNGVLRNYLRGRERIKFPEDRDEYLSVFYSFPLWMIKYWKENFGENNTIKLCDYFNSKPRLYFRINSLRVNKEDFEKGLDESKLRYKKGDFLDNFYYIESRLDLDNFLPFQKGWIYVQDESAGFPVLLLDPKPNETILDLCIAPGGKATYIAELMMNKGKIIGVDLSPERIEMTRKNCESFGTRIIQLCLADATNFSCKPVDRVLLDAPCTGLGVLGRNADSRWRKKPEDIKRMHSLQKSILLNSANLIKKGGTLVYSTCTLTSEENEGVIKDFLKEQRDFELVDPSKFVDKRFVDQNKMVRIFPFRDNLDGGFCCRMEKR